MSARLSALFVFCVCATRFTARFAGHRVAGDGNGGWVSECMAIGQHAVSVLAMVHSLFFS